MNRIKVKTGIMYRSLSPFTAAAVLFWVCILLASASIARSQQSNAEKYPPGLIVTAVAKGSPAEQAGLKVGDVLLSFDGKPTRFESQVGPYRDRAIWDGKKTVAIAVRRGSDGMSLNLVPALVLGMTAQPPLPMAAQKLLDGANALPKDQGVAALAKLRAAAEAAAKAGDARAAAWIRWQAYNDASNGPTGGQEALNASLSFAQVAGDGLLGATCLHRLGNAAYGSNKLDGAEVYYKRALAIRERLAPDSLDLAASLNNQGIVAWVLRGKLDEAEAHHKRALAIRERLAPDSLDLAASLNNLGVVARARGKLDEAEAYYKRDLAITERLAPDSLDLAAILNNLGIVAEIRGKLDEAEAFYKRDLPITERLAPDSLDLASTLNNLGNVAGERGKLDEAEAYYKRALAIRERLAPDSLDLAGTLNNLGNVARRRGRLDEAEAYHKRALAIRERLAPDSLDLAASLNNLGNVADDRGKLDEAEAFNKRALVIKERLAPDSLSLASTLNNLGLVADDRGKLDEAEAFYKRDLPITERLAPDSLDLASTLNNLGNVAGERGKLDEAEAYYKRALTIRERLAPDSLDLAGTLNNLGNVARRRGRLDEAEAYHKRALAIRERLAPDSLDLAASLNNQGNVADDRGKLDEAEAFYKRALAIKARLAPDSLDLAASLTNLGNVAENRGKLDEAEAFYKRALAITERLAPDSLDLARSLNNLGLVAYDRSNLGEAEDLYTRSWRIVKNQGAFVAGDTGRQEFGTAYGSYAADLLATQLKRNETDKAFATLEEGRAQALVAAFAEHGVTEKLTPPEIWRPYHAAETAHNVAFKDTERAEADVEKARAVLLASQKQQDDEAIVRQKQHDLDDAEKLFEPKYTEEVQTREEMESCWASVLRAAKAAIPASIEANEARKDLPPGTLMLEFACSEKEVILFAATVQGVQSHILTSKRDELEAKVKFVRGYTTQGADDRGTHLVSGSEAETAALRVLFQKLFPPEVQKAIAQAKHVVISPDDFLWDLPFAALVTNASGKPTYLGLEKPLSYAQSLTVLVTPPPARGAAGSGALVVGNPIYDNTRRPEILAEAKRRQHTTPGPLHGQVKLAAARRDYELAMLTMDGKAPDQLPGAEKEAQSVAALYKTSAHIGIEPTEAWFRAHVSNAKIIHLATHGFLNAYSAQSSGVLLAIPEKTPPPDKYDNDGALQAWEVWSLKLKADLVVLSACETGRGAKVTGEGLIGLTRAFQYAGARTIVSSQWKVNDASTAALMTSFHKHLLAGAERDEALRLAMCEVATSITPGWSEPYHWAAFVMVGDTGKMR